MDGSMGMSQLIEGGDGDRKVPRQGLASDRVRFIGTSDTELEEAIRGSLEGSANRPQTSNLTPTKRNSSEMTGDVQPVNDDDVIAVDDAGEAGSSSIKTGATAPMSDRLDVDARPVVLRRRQRKIL